MLEIEYLGYLSSTKEQARGVSEEFKKAADDPESYFYDQAVSKLKSIFGGSKRSMLAGVMYVSCKSGMERACNAIKLAALRGDKESFNDLRKAAKEQKVAKRYYEDLMQEVKRHVPQQEVQRRVQPQAAMTSKQALSKELHRLLLLYAKQWSEYQKYSYGSADQKRVGSHLVRIRSRLFKLANIPE